MKKHREQEALKMFFKFKSLEKTLVLSNKQIRDRWLTIVTEDSVIGSHDYFKKYVEYELKVFPSIGIDALTEETLCTL